jgi:hypothetical protein
MRMLAVHEPISVKRSQHSHAPMAFTWRTRQHRVRVIEGFNDEIIELAQGMVNRRTYRLRTHTGLRCSISYDEHRELWRMESVHP